jgi:prevent-host-death family protein
VTPPRWALQDAKNRLSEVVDAAVRGEPQVVTRRGVETAVIISHDEYLRMTAAQTEPRQSIAQYLVDGPAVSGGDVFERINLRPRGAR